ncbi:MAG: NAD(P)-dependent oxidoreductase [Clostridia bacterium]|nr:NAD(P)-dependent oxidoreductase [Clostridia bacterium]
MDLSIFEGSKILVTGASGLIGQALVKKLILHKGKKPVEVYALVRNEEKARAVFSKLPQEHLHYTVCDACGLKPENLGINYIVHGASKTASKDFVSEPVEVILNSVDGTKSLLEFARANPVKGFVYLSTMEVYGAPSTDEKIFEDHASTVDTMSVRSSYPESKRLCESLCSAYAAEYGVPAKVVRLTQTFGEGVDYNDGRVFAEFARCAIEGKDIVLKTKGETKRNYIDVQDTADAILTVLVKGVAGEAYNAANEETYCSILEMANLVAKEFGCGKIKVRIEEGDVAKLGYAPTLKMNLSTAKLQGLGWSASVNLKQSFERMIDYMKNKWQKK